MTASAFAGLSPTMLSRSTSLNSCRPKKTRNGDPMSCFSANRKHYAEAYKQQATDIVHQRDGERVIDVTNSPHNHGVLDNHVLKQQLRDSGAAYSVRKKTSAYVK